MWFGCSGAVLQVTEFVCKREREIACVASSCLFHPWVLRGQPRRWSEQQAGCLPCDGSEFHAQRSLHSFPGGSMASSTNSPPAGTVVQPLSLGLLELWEVPLSPFADEKTQAQRGGGSRNPENWHWCYPHEFANPL